MAYGPIINLRDFSPDLPPLSPGQIVDMSGFTATLDGLRVMPSFVAAPGEAPLPGPCLGAYDAHLVNGTHVVVAAANDGGVGRLFVHAAGTWLRADSGQSFSPTASWTFTVFGDYIFAVNGVDPTQILIGPPGPPPSGFKPLSTIIAALPGPDSAAQAAALAVLEPLSIIEATDYGIFAVSTKKPAAWFFTATGLTWIPDIATLTVQGPNITATPGPITALHRHRTGLAVIYKETGLYVGQFTGPPFVWTFQTVSQTIGTPSQNTVVDAGDVHYFIGPADFEMFDGSSLAPIPNAVKEWFFRHVADAAMPAILGRYDLPNNAVVWHYNSRAHPTGPRDELIAYNVRTQKWTKGTLAVESTMSPHAHAMGPLDYAQWSIDFGQFGAPTDLGYSATGQLTYDSQAFGAESAEVQAIIDPTHTLLLQNGPAQESFLLTGEIGDGKDYYQLNQVRPVFAVWPQDNYGELRSYKKAINGYPTPDINDFPQPFIGPVTWLNKNGAWPLIVVARAHQLRMRFTAGCEITGVALDTCFVGGE